MVHIIKSVPYVADELIQAFKQHGTATVHEAMGKRGALHGSIRSLERGMKLCGRALTVKCHDGDNLMLIKAVNMAKAGDVIVVDMGKAPYAGPFGEVLAVECMAKQVAGIVIAGSVRDSEALIKMGLPVFSSHLSIVGTVKTTLGTINHPIACGGEIIHPGDILLGDDDGVVVIPLNEAEAALTESEKRAAGEQAVMERLKCGESLFDIYGYQKVFDRLGCIEEE